MANLVELFDNIVQMQALNGVPLANGKLYVYALGRTRLMDTWSDVDGESLNTNPIILDDAGQAHCYVSDDFDYTLVVCDAYNNEVFSIDKYLYSKGEHSHADVAVAPSEHIAVSSYHVGETTVYVPYIQGELGKTYHGIEPIVVNNQENKISARNIPLGVQEPLYFVEDSESACIIGASGLQPSGNYATVDWVIEHDYMQKEKLEFNESGQVTGFDGSAFAAGYVEPSDFIPWSASGEFQSAGNYATTDDLTAYYPTSNPSGFINSDAISAMATTGLVADVSADITAIIPSTAGLATENWVTSQGYLTEHQSLDGLMSANLLESSGGLITGYNGTAFAGQGGGGITGEYELSAGNGISIDNYPIEQKTVISVTGNYATEDWVTGQGYLTAETDWTNTITAASANAYNEATAAIPAPFDPSYLSGQIDTKLDSAIYAADSGNFLTAHQSLEDYQTIAGMTAYQSAGDYYSASNPSGFITGVDLTPYQTIEGMTAYQPVGDYLTTGDSAEFYTTANESGFITGVDLTPYQLIADMTAYQPAGDYLTTADSANFYTTANTAGYISEVPDTYLQNTDLSTEDGKVTAISGIPLSAGGDVPEGVMVESGLEYNAVQEISAYNGSAIAQYGAEKQWLVHDDTLTHISNSAQYALGVNLSAVAKLLGVDETVLYSAPTIDGVSAGQLSESKNNFSTLRYDVGYSGGYNNNEGSVLIDIPASYTGNWLNYSFGAGGANLYYAGAKIVWTNDTTFAINHATCIVHNENSTAVSGVTAYNAGCRLCVNKIIGIGRKS